MKTILKYFDKVSGRSVTNQRRLLLELIRSAQGHLDADELFRQAKKHKPRISLATVYRNLKLFKELGLIAESNLGKAHSHYEIKGTVEHHHLVCLGCGLVVEFDSPLITAAKTRIQKEKGFDIVTSQLKMEGYCPKCKLKKNSP
ncbi:MAG: transcriptional repressor [Syntrophales bacterium]|jgi:Fur family ferric uptake transcriptional regulator|nr:transcriptional repressor [Syntrophales bacterium]